MIDKVEDQFLWVESYRPQSIDDCVLPEALKNTFKSYVAQGELPTFLFSGTAGVGKTTVAKALCNEIGAEYIMINGSDEGRSIDTLRTTIRSFASTVSLTDAKKVVIIDEADYMNCFDSSQKVFVVEEGNIVEKTMESLSGGEKFTVASVDDKGNFVTDTAYCVQSGEKEVFEVTFEDGSTIMCTKDHPFFNENFDNISGIDELDYLNSLNSNLTIGEPYGTSSVHISSDT